MSTRILLVTLAILTGCATRPNVEAEPATSQVWLMYDMDTSTLPTVTWLDTCEETSDAEVRVFDWTRCLDFSVTRDGDIRVRQHSLPSDSRLPVALLFYSRLLTKGLLGSLTTEDQLRIRDAYNMLRAAGL